MRTLFATLSVALPGLLAPPMSQAIEEPDYEVLRKVGEVEVRQ